jgi:hypothetical protein
MVRIIVHLCRGVSRLCVMESFSVGGDLLAFEELSNRADV